MSTWKTIRANFTTTRIRLVVGTINLVEKIADLANGPPRARRMPRRPPAAKPEMRQQLAKEADEYLFKGPRRRARSRDGRRQGQDVKKEGLSEYFLFTIEGERRSDKRPMRLVAMKIADVRSSASTS